MRCAAAALGGALPRPRSRPYHCGYVRSLRPCIALAHRARRRGTFHQALLVVAHDQGLMSRRLAADVLYGRRKGDAARPERPACAATAARPSRRAPHGATHASTSAATRRVCCGSWSRTWSSGRRRRRSRLVLDGSLAVSFAQTRSHGVVGRSETTLALGLPLLEALPASEVRALLAVELAGSGRARPQARPRGRRAERC